MTALSQRRRPSAPARWWYAIAALCGVLALGLPWRKTVEFGVGFSGTPGFCYSAADADGWLTTYCDPWSPSLAMQPHLAELTGAQSPVRVLLALTLVALVVGYRRGIVRLLRWAPAVAAVGLFGFGVTGEAGQISYVLGLVALVVALRRDGALVLDRPKLRPAAT